MLTACISFGLLQNHQLVVVVVFSILNLFRLEVSNLQKWETNSKYVTQHNVNLQGIRWLDDSNWYLHINSQTCIVDCRDFGSKVAHVYFENL